MDAGVARASPLDQQHREHGARMTLCGGVQMPSWYAGRGAIFEARAVRENVGLFDYSHLSRLFVTGSGAIAGLARALTYDLRTIAVGDSHEALLCSEYGGVLQRVRLHHLGEVRWLLTSKALQNASVDLSTQIPLAAAEDCRIEDRTRTTAMLALQGPLAAQLLGDLLSPAITERTPSWHSTEIELYGHKAVLLRTGAPHGDGFQIVSGIDAARHLWHLLLAAGATPCGLTADEILRQEIGLATVGHELDGDANPYEAGLGSLVSLGGADFLGRPALEKLPNPPARRLTYLVAASRNGVFRQGFPVSHGSRQIAHLTSGGFSPARGRAIGMAYVPAEVAQPGTELAIGVRGRKTIAVVNPTPAFDPPGSA